LHEKNFFKKYYLLNLAKRLKLFEISIINNYSALIPITKKDSEVFAKFGNFKPVCIVPAGVKIVKSIACDTIVYPSICYIGALDWIPNQQGLIWFIEKVLPLIIQQNKGIQIYIAGRNAPDWFVKRISISNITYLGEVDNAYDFINKYAIMIVPLFSGSGMRVKIVEGLNLGKAIVSTSLGTEGIEITNRQNILIADTPEEFAGCILELSQKYEFYREICKNARELVMQKYDNTLITNNLLTFIGGL
jgi:glycosyltransferase involved in cell wall biosynthesis